MLCYRPHPRGGMSRATSTVDNHVVFCALFVLFWWVGIRSANIWLQDRNVTTSAVWMQLTHRGGEKLNSRVAFRFHQSLKECEGHHQVCAVVLLMSFTGFQLENHVNATKFRFLVLPENVSVTFDTLCPFFYKLTVAVFADSSFSVCSRRYSRENES